MKYKQEFINMVDLGRLFGVSSHKVGKWLKELNLRDKYGTPTRQAYDQKLLSYDYERWGTYTTLWNAERTVSVLEEAGHTRIADPPDDLVEPPRLKGPFSVQQADRGKWHISGTDGEVVVFVVGQENARFIGRLLNTAERSGAIERNL